MKKRLTTRSTIGGFVLLGAIAGICASPAVAQTVTRSPAGYFEFHVDPWVSLHHFAYHFVRAEESQRRLRGRVSLAEEDRRAMSADVRNACMSLRSAYQPYIEGNLLFDPDTRAIAEALVDGVEAVPDKSVRNALTACMPGYREALWPRHRAASANLLQRLMAQLGEHEEMMADRFAATLEGSWPGSPIRVDLTAYANWAGAYTDDSPPNITISSYDDDVAAHAFELLFHEAGHTISFETSLLAAANAALEATGLESDRYWHFILFYAAGRVTAEVLEDPSYVPYADATGLTRRESSAPFYDALSTTWDTSDSLRERALSAAEHVAAARR